MQKSFWATEKLMWWLVDVNMRKRGGQEMPEERSLEWLGILQSANRLMILYHNLYKIS